MRLDVRKSLVLGDAKQMTPTVNLMNPQWRQSFQSALKKLGGEFKTVDFRVPKDVEAAVDAQAKLEQTRVGAQPVGVGPQAESLPEARSYVERMQSAADRVPHTVSPTIEQTRTVPNSDRTIQASTIGGHAGNALALALARSRNPRLQLLGAAANFLTPTVAGAAGAPLSDNIVDADLRTEAPGFRASALLADAEAARLRGEGGNSDALGKFYAGNLPVFDAYKESRPGLSNAGINALINSEVGSSMAITSRVAAPAAQGLLRRALTGVPTIGASVGGTLSVGSALMANYNANAENAKIREQNVQRKEQGLPLLPELVVPAPWGDPSTHTLIASQPIAGYMGAKAPGWAAKFLAKPLAARAGLGALAELTGAQIAARGGMAAAGTAALPATLAVNALSGGHQLMSASHDPRVTDEARRDDALAGHGVGTGLGRTLMGDPIGAATVFDSIDPNSEVSVAARREAEDAQRGVAEFTSPDGKEIRVPYDKLKQHVQMRKALEAAPSVSNAMLAQLVTRAQTGYGALKYQAQRPFTRLTEEEAAVPAREVAQHISSSWQLPLTQTAVNEITRLVQVLGPQAVASALSKSDSSDRLDEMRLQAVLNHAWVPPEVYRQRSAIYNSFYRPAPVK